MRALARRGGRVLAVACCAGLAGAQVWVEQAIAPPAPAEGIPAVAADDQRGRLVVLDARGHVWEHDGHHWFRRVVTTGLPAGPRRLLAWDAARRVCVAVESSRPPALPAAVHEWNGEVWQQAASAPGGTLTALAYDRSRGRLVAFTAGAVHERDSASLQWQSIAIAATLPVRSATWDPVRGVVLAWNGQELHAWNGAGLTLLGSELLGGSCAFDPVRQVAVIAGAGGGADQTWEWDGANFTQRAVPPLQRPAAALVHHPAANALVLFGGEAIAQLNPPHGDAWLLGAGGWAPLPPGRIAPKPAGATFGSAPCLDTARNRVVAVEPFPMGGMTWEFDGWAWTQRPGAPGVMFPSLAYDQARARTILFGGAHVHGPIASMWSYDGAGWTALTPATPPPQRLGAAMAYDAARQQVLLYGGSSGTVSLYDTWTWDGTDWLFRTATGPRLPATNPPVRLIAFDAARIQIAMIGLAQAFVYEDWVWDGTSWSQRPGPTPATFAIAHDPLSGDLVTLAQENGQGTLRRWNGVAWSSQPVDLPQPAPGFLWSDALAQRLRGLGDGASHLFSPTPSTVDGRGAGCGSPPPRLLARSLPAVGNAGFGFDVFEGGSHAAVFLLLSLAADDRPLDPWVPQAAGCRVLVGTPAVTSLVLTDGSGFATAGVAIPPVPALRGLAVSAQLLGVDGSLRIVLSAARDLRVGD